MKFDNLKDKRLGLEKLNNQGSLMKIIEYNNAHNIIIQFQDEYKYTKTTTWGNFITGQIKNPYYLKIFNKGVIGEKYNICINGKPIKEYICWKFMLQRCYDEEYKNNKPTYKDVTCCDEWLLFENFYEWLHSQENFDKWYNNNHSAIDKDILFKGNKIYSPEKCCLVPYNVNSLFTKSDATRGEYPIGVSLKNDKFMVRCHDGYNHSIFLGYYSTADEVFNVYKNKKEEIIKQVAQEEYNKGNITKKCYDAMMNYQVEITD